MPTPETFETLEEALAAVCFTGVWPDDLNIKPGQEVSYLLNGTHISVYRDEHGSYELPIMSFPLHSDWLT
jgi:hypothetical protein